MKINTTLAQIGNRRDSTGAISFPVYYSATFGHPALGAVEQDSFLFSMLPITNASSMNCAKMNHLAPERAIMRTKCQRQWNCWRIARRC